MGQIISLKVQKQLKEASDEITALLRANDENFLRIGHGLILIRELCYDNGVDWLTFPAKLGISYRRAILYIQIAELTEKHPYLSHAQLLRIGCSKLGMVSRMLGRGEAKDKVLLAKAEASSATKLRAFCKGEPTHDTLFLPFRLNFMPAARAAVDQALIPYGSKRTGPRSFVNREAALLRALGLDPALNDILYAAE